MKELEKVFDVGFQSTIEISLNKGTVEIWGWDNPTCKVEAQGEGKIEFDYNLRENYLNMEFAGGDKKVQLYVPMYSKLLVDGSYVDTTVANFQGNIVLEVSKGNSKFSNLDCKGIIEMEKGEIQLENIRGNWNIENGKGNINVYKCNGSLNIENGHGDLQLTGLNGDCDVENGNGSIVVKESEGSLNLYNGVGDLTLDYCTFKRFAAEGKGLTNIIVSSNHQGVWRISRSGDFQITVPVVAQLDFKVWCNGIDNSVPGLYMDKSEDYYRGTLGVNPKGSIYIEDAKQVSLIKGISHGSIDVDLTEEDEKETLKILEMLKQGIITSDEANDLLEAINGSTLEGVEVDE